MSQPVNIAQSVAVLVDGNNIEMSIHTEAKNKNTMLNFDSLIPKLIGQRGLNRLMYFREGVSISKKLSERLHQQFFGVTRACYKNADVPLTIEAVRLADKVDTIIIMSGDSDYIDLVKHLKSNGVRVEIASVKSTTSHDLVEEADYYHEITKDDWFVYNAPKTNFTPAKAVQRR